jgi:glutathione S-transferase
LDCRWEVFFVDLNCFCWVNWAEWAGISLQPFLKLQKWLVVINGRGAVKSGLDVPDKFEMKKDEYEGKRGGVR